MASVADRKAAVLDRLNIDALIRDFFSRLTPAGANQVLVCCPAHDDQHASCSINTKTGLWNCKACGAAGNVFDLYLAVRGCVFLTALCELEERAGITPSTNKPTRKQTATPRKTTQTKKAKKPAKKSPRGPAVAVYRYFDAEGRFCYGKRRHEPGRDGKSKEFSFFHSTGKKERAGRGTSPPLLYGLHALATAPAGERVFIVEGEGKVDALAAWGLIAVCTDSGAAGKWPERFTDLFRGREVVILPDNDAPGEKYAARVAEALTGVAAAVLVLRLPDLPEKGDLLDWIYLQQQQGAANA